MIIRKSEVLSVILLILFSAVGCTDKNESALEEEIFKDVADKSSTEEENEEITPTINGADGIDVDLTNMSSTMVYSEVYNMVVDPDVYMGKIIKISGTCKIYHSDETGKDYYACLISDAMGCCSQGIEFYTTDESYPDEGAEITLSGRFDTYKEGDNTYCALMDARML